MSVYSASGSSYPVNRAARTSPPRQSALDWARKRAVGRTTRRVAAAGDRAGQRLQQQLGSSWRVVAWPPHGQLSPSQDQTGLLAIGPAGVFAVSLVEHGRQRVLIAGDVIQIKGDRPPYVSRARRFARTARAALTAVVGTTVPVVPVLTFSGAGTISAHGLPTGCLVVKRRELDRLLTAAGNKITPETAQKLADVARHPATWGGHLDR